MEHKKHQEFDLHGHTKEGRVWGFDERTTLSPEEAVKRAKEVDLDGIAITNHDTKKGLDEALNAGAKHGIIVVPGVEISARPKNLSGQRHILALGLTPEMIKGKLPFWKKIEDTVKLIHDMGGLAIATHPRRLPDGYSLTNREVKKYDKLWDGVETHTLRGVNKEMDIYAQAYDKAKLGSSDFHMPEQIGIIRTAILRDVRTWQDVIVAIKNKQTKPFIKDDIPEHLLRHFRRYRLMDYNTILNGQQ